MQTIYNWTSRSIIPISKKLTVPRIELLGNLITSRLVLNVLGALKTEIAIGKVYCWTDSKISLSWIKSINKEFKPFVENRLVEIRKNVDVSNWYYCRSEINPADLITRGGNNLESKLWFNGPDFLYQTIQY